MFLEKSGPCLERPERGGPADCWGKRGFKEYKWNRSFLYWFVGLFVLVQEFLSCLFICSSQPCIISSPYTIHLSPSPCKMGRRSCRVACLLKCVSALAFFLHPVAGCRTGPPAYVACRAGTTTLCQSRLIPPVRDYEFSIGMQIRMT